MSRNLIRIFNIVACITVVNILQYQFPTRGRNQDEVLKTLCISLLFCFCISWLKLETAYVCQRNLFPLCTPPTAILLAAISEKSTITTFPVPLFHSLYAFKCLSILPVSFRFWILHFISIFIVSMLPKVRLCTFSSEDTQILTCWLHFGPTHRKCTLCDVGNAKIRKKMDAMQP